MDRALVEKAGIPFKGIFSGKLRRYFAWQTFLAPFLVLAGFFQAFYWLVRFWPHAVFSKGGYVGLPVALAAWILRRPLILHESDAVMGLANRFTARLARRVLLGFPGSLALSTKVEVVGNPVRPFIAGGSKEKGYALTGFTPDRPVLLVWGGSQGAQEINELIAAHFNELKAHFQIVHVTGRGKSISLQDPAYKAFEYLDSELPHVYAITDLVFGRAGANSLAEIAYLQKPNVILPLLSAANHHQEINAAYFEAQGAGIVLKDKGALVTTLVELVNAPVRLAGMKEALAKIANPGAAAAIAKLIIDLHVK